MLVSLLPYRMLLSHLQAGHERFSTIDNTVS
jgi:hypothetical protein